nr:MAG: polyprotein [Wufeng shrew picorna-like virus 9]
MLAPTQQQQRQISRAAMEARNLIQATAQGHVTQILYMTVVVIGTLLYHLPTIPRKRKVKTRNIVELLPPTMTTNVLDGASQQTTEDEDVDINQISSLLEDNLKEVGVPSLLALSTTTSFIAIVVTIIGYVKTTGKKSKFLIGAIVLQIIQLVLQIVHLSFPSFEPKGLFEFSKKRLTTVLTPPKIITSAPMLTTFVRSEAKTVEEANAAIKNFRRNYPRTNIDHILELPEGPSSEAETIAWLDEHPLAVNFWTSSVIKRLYQFTDQQKLLIDNWQPASKSYVVPESDDFSDEFDEEAEKAFEEFLIESGQMTPPPTNNQEESDDDYDGTPLEFGQTGSTGNILPSVEEARLALAGATREVEVNWFKEILGEMIGLLGTLTVCIINFTLGKQVDFTTVERNWKGIDFLKERFSSTVEKLSRDASAPTPEEAQQNQVSQYIESLNNLLSIPHTTYATRADLRDELDLKCREVENFLKVPLSSKMVDKSVLFSLYTAANSMRVEVQRASKIQTIRQEPRLVLFFGEGAVGKTKTMQNLAAKLGRKKYANIDAQKRTVAITARSKYFPLLSGEPIWTVDEIGSSVNYQEEIIFKDLRGLCSSARFGADTAEIQGKDQEANPHIILATVNTHPDAIMQRLSMISGPESVEPSASRMMIYYCARNETQYGKIDLRNRDNLPCDKSGAMKHVLYYPMQLNHNTKLYETASKAITFDDIYDQVSAKMDNLRSQYLEHLDVMMGTSKQMQSVSHFVINLFGLPKAGKGRACDLVLPQLKAATNYPVVQLDRKQFMAVNQKFDRRVILVCDDVFNYQVSERAAQEQQYMEIFNNYLMPGSIIMFITNIIPETALPKFDLCFRSVNLMDFCSLLPSCDIILPHITASRQKKLRINEPGCVRRMGYTGNFVANTAEDTNICFEVNNDSYVEQSRTTDRLDVTVHIFSFLLFPIIYFNYYLAILFVFSAFLFLWKVSRCGTQKYTISEVFDRCYNQYQNFLKINDLVTITRGPLPVCTDLDIDLEAVSVQSIYATLNPVPHFFTNRANFMRAMLPWKIYVRTELTTALLNVSNKLRGTIPPDNEAGCIEYLSNLRRLLLSEGFNAKIRGNIASVGQFYLSGNVITVVNNNEGLEFIPIILDDRVVFRPTDMEIGPRSFTLSEIAAYHINNVELIDVSQTPSAEAVALRKALIDPVILSDKGYLAARTAIRIEKTKNISVKYYQKFNETFQELMSTTTGKIILAIVGVIVTSLVGYGLYKLFAGKKARKSRMIVVDDSDSEFEQQKGRKGGLKSKPRSEWTDTESRARNLETQAKGKRKPRARDDMSADESHRVKHGRKTTRTKIAHDPLSSDDDKRVKHSTAESRRKERFQRFMANTSFQIKEMVKAVPQSVKELPDMNGYNEFKNVIGEMHEKIKKNEVYVVSLPNKDDVIVCDSKEKRDNMIKNAARCYGLVIEKHNIVTVGHLYSHAKKFSQNVYVCADELGNNLYRCELVKEFTQVNRDLSFWQISVNKESKRIQSFPSIRKHFISSLEKMPDYSDCIMKRYAENKTEQFLYASCLYMTDRTDAVDANGEPYSLEKYGFCWFSFCLLALTTYGDCGLPYYNIVDDGAFTGSKQIKISGIHCMGNIKDNSAIGISAILSQEDFKHFDRFTQEVEEEKCKFCEDKNIRIGKPLPEKDESDSKYDSVHEIVWNNDHNGGVRSVVREAKYYFEAYPNFTGKVRKSFGKLAQGTQEHSHCHFISNKFMEEPQLYNQWVKFDSEKWGKDQLTYSRRIASLNAVLAFFGDHAWIEEYTMFMNRENIEKTRKGRSRVVTVWWMEIIVHKHGLTEKELENLLKEVPKTQIDLTTLPAELAEEVEFAQECHFINDVPIVPQETVKLVGSFRTSQSRTPDNDFKVFPLGHKLENSYTKIPFNPNSDDAPEEQLVQLKFNNFGERCARTTQCVQWQGVHKQPDVFLARQIESEYYKHLARDYRGLTELSDKEVMYGFKASRVGLDRLQLKKSIGWSLQSLFNVTLKEDVIQVNDKGTYSWLDNEAAVFAKKWYGDAKMAVRENRRPVFFYMDLLKMEKLKPEKNFLGRIFCAADLVGIMIQRKFLGHFVVQSTLKDDCVGVGSNPWVVFNDIARNCLKKKNVFTADYKRWDKTVPAWAFERLGVMLDKVNNVQYYSLMFKDMYQAYHVSGTTLYQTLRGMPSGALPTANLNSKVNDFVLFSAFVKLVGPYNDVSYNDYTTLVYRKFYGDDVIIAVDDSIKQWFNMVTVRKTLSEMFGFVLDSSEKDGQITEFMEWNQLSWCSRYPRRLAKYNFFVGALKKITINSMLHYERKNNPSEVYAVQLNNAMFEAAAWEEEYFDSIVRDVEFIRSKRPELSKYILIMTYEEYQEEMYTEGIKGKLIHYLYTELEDLQDQGVELGNKAPITNFNEGVIDDAPPLFEIVNTLCLLKNLHEPNMSGQNHCDEPTDYVSALNLLWQHGKITQPAYEFDFVSNWTCTATCSDTSTGNTLTGSGSGTSKPKAKQLAAQALYHQIVNQSRYSLNEIEEYLNGATFEMNMSPPDQVPSVKTTGMDVSLTAGSHIFSNTQFAQGVTDLNSVAFSLNNIAQTGAPFDIRDSCKSIYQIEGNFTVSGVQGVGTEIFRLSLDPENRPALHKQYIQMHEDHIPAVDFGVYVGGASGAIGTIKIGFVRDISKAAYTLAEIQQIASQDVSLGQSSTVNFILRDIRRSGLYRKVLDDPEPYPGIVAIISNPITNVQRNDSVQYPIQVYSKLSADYQLASPVAVKGSTTITDIALSTYFDTAQFDIAVNSATITDAPNETAEFPDCGWNTGKFTPTFSAKNIYAFSTVHQNAEDIVVYTVDYDKSSERASALGGFTTDKASVMDQIGFGFGILPARRHPYTGNQDLVTAMKGFTVWAVQSFDIFVGDVKYTCNTILLSEFGCVLVGQCLYTRNAGAKQYIVRLNQLSSPVKILCPYSTDNTKYTQYGIAQENNTGKSFYKVRLTCYGNDLFDQQPDWSYGSSFTDSDGGSHFDVVTPANESFSSSFAPLYQWTFTATGNNAPTSAAPTGMQRLFFVRSGSTLNSAMPVNAPQIPGALRLTQMLDNYLDAQKGDFLTMSFGQDAISSDFQVAYKNGVFLVRNATEQQIRVALSNTAMLKSITAVNSAQSINSFVNTGFSTWLSATTNTFINKMAVRRLMNGMQKQAGWATAASALGGLFGGISNGMQNSINWDNYNKNQDLNRQMQQQLVEMQGKNSLALSKQNFDQQLSLKGLTSTSSQAGNNQGVGYSTAAPTPELRQPDTGNVSFTPGGTMTTPMSDKDFGYEGDPNKRSMVNAANNAVIQNIEGKQIPSMEFTRNKEGPTTNDLPSVAEARMAMAPGVASPSTPTPGIKLDSSSESEA